MELADGTTIRGKVEKGREFLRGQEARVSTQYGVTTGKVYGNPPDYFLSVTQEDGKKILINARMITKVERIE